VSKRTINLFLDEIGAFYEFDDFKCFPEDCCKLNYAVVNDLNPSALVLSSEVELLRTVTTGRNRLNFLSNNEIKENIYYIFAKTSEDSTNILDSNMKDMDLSQYIGITVNTTCNPEKSSATEGAYPANFTNIQVTCTGSSAYFVMPNFNISDERCKITDIEAIDEGENIISDLEVSLVDNQIRPKDPKLNNEYNFTLRATVNGGNYTIGTNKTFRVWSNQTSGTGEGLG